MAAFLGFLTAVLDFLAELFALFARVVVFFAGILKRLVVLLQLTFHAVELGLRFIQLFLPGFRAVVGFAERKCCVGERLLQQFDLVSLLVDRAVQNGVAGVQRLYAFVLLVKLRRDQRHFRAEDFHRRVDVFERAFKFTLTLDAQLDAGVTVRTH